MALHLDWRPIQAVPAGGLHSRSSLPRVRRADTTSTSLRYHGRAIPLQHQAPPSLHIARLCLVLSPASWSLPTPAQFSPPSECSYRSLHFGHPAFKAPAVPDDIKITSLDESSLHAPAVFLPRLGRLTIPFFPSFTNFITSILAPISPACRIHQHHSSAGLLLAPRCSAVPRTCSPARAAQARPILPHLEPLTAQMRAHQVLLRLRQTTPSSCPTRP